MLPRPYQIQSIQAINDRWQHHQATLLILATGLGKTVTFSHIANERLPLGRVLVLVHRDELLRQAAEKLHQITGIQPGIEQGATRSSNEQIVIASVYSIKNRLKDFNPYDFMTVIVDETHHVTSNSWFTVIKYFQQNLALKTLGVTATPIRLDGIGLGKVFQSVAFQYDAPDAIKDGWLVPIQSKIIDVRGLDYSLCRETAGDLNQSDASKALEDDRVLHQVAKSIVYFGLTKTLAFCVTLSHAEKLTKYLNALEPGSTRWVSGKMPKLQRRALLEDFAQKKFRILCNVGVLTEGFDDPSIECVAMVRPTMSVALYTQMLGRGLRPLPGVVDGLVNRWSSIGTSGKKVLLVLDFVGNSGQHSLVTAGNVLNGTPPKDPTPRKKMPRHSKTRTVNWFQLLDGTVSFPMKLIWDGIKKVWRSALKSAKKA